MSATTSQKYGTILTAAGKQIIADAVANDVKVALKYVAVGDGAGEEYIPDERQTSLRNQVYQAEANGVYIDSENPNRIIVELVIPEKVGGWTIREAAIKTSNGTVIAIGTSPSCYKPTLPEGAAAGFGYKFILEVTNSDVVTITLDPSAVYATIQYVNNVVNSHVNNYAAHGGTPKAEPNKIIRRDGYARAEVKDPKNPKEIVNKQFMEYYFHTFQGVGNIDKPVILAPEDDALQQSLTFPIEISEIAPLIGGEVYPMYTRYLVTSGDKTVLYPEVTVPYTTTPEITVSDDEIGKTVLIRVQYETVDAQKSAWSDPKPVTIASPLAKSVPVTAPLRGKTGVLLKGLTVTLADGEWSDGSTFVGAQSKIELFDEATGQSLYDSGWQPYRLDFVIPDGILAVSKGYWVRGQHIAASAPASNPDAILTTPVVYRDSMAASYFFTTAPMAPNVTALRHTIPGAILKGTFEDVMIFGATSADGGAVTYRIDESSITGGLAFSKYSGIGETEVIKMSAPSIAGTVADASLRIVAVSESGAESAPVPVRVVILGQDIWIFEIAGTFSWTAPVAGYYDIFVGAGGQPLAGAGSGSAISREVNLVGTYSLKPILFINHRHL